jgi:probable blue pigment (indigoidine) exporter
MEAKWRWILLAAIAPVAWGSTYAVTRATLPADDPIYGALLRAAPAGLVLLAVARELPHGSWWWKSAVLGVLNIGGFFVLVYVTAQLLPSGSATTIMSLSATVMALLGWLVLGERPAAATFLGAGIGAAGVALMVSSSTEAPAAAGIGSAVAAMLASSVGFVLTKRWLGDERVLAVTAWQLIAGSLLLAPVAVLVDGPPPPLSATGIAGAAYVSLIATAVAYVTWFHALARIPVAAIGLVGLLNPVTGVALGATLGGEPFGWIQAVGTALVVGGLVVAVRPRSRSRRGPAPSTSPVTDVPAGTSDTSAPAHVPVQCSARQAPDGIRGAR